MNINTRLKRIELTKREQERLGQAREIAELLDRHGDGEIKTLANKVCKAMAELQLEMNRQAV